MVVPCDARASSSAFDHCRYCGLQHFHYWSFLLPTLLVRSCKQLEPKAKPTCAPSRIAYKSDRTGGLDHPSFLVLSYYRRNCCTVCSLRSIQVQVHSRSEAMCHSRSASSGAMKEQQTRKAESSRMVTWWKVLMQRSVHDKAGPDPPSPVYVTAGEVVKTPSDEVAPSVKASDAAFFWRIFSTEKRIVATTRGDATDVVCLPHRFTFHHSAAPPTEKITTLRLTSSCGAGMAGWPVKQGVFTSGEWTGLRPQCGLGRSSSWTRFHGRRSPQRAPLKVLAKRVDEGGGVRTAVVVGAGWAGFGAAHALTKLGVSVTVLDASPSPGGLSTGFRTARGRPVEAGLKGFWWQYHNIYSLLKELNVVWPFTDWTMSSFYSPEGIQVEAPVFNALPRLPTPIGSFLYTSPYFRSLSVVDRLTALPLVQALLEFDADEETYARYDAMTARELFRKAGVSAKLYRDFLQPILLVTLFAPGEQLSAAAALGALYYYVLAHQADFDVCWCKGSVAEVIFKPWLERMKSQGCRVLGNSRVVDVIHDDESNKITGIVAMDGGGERTVYDADVVVFAVGIQAMQRIVASSPALAGRSEFATISNLGTVDVLATRLWLDRRVPLKNPSNVLAGFEPTTGATVFDLNALQDEFAGEPGSVFEVDFYHANQLLPLTNDAVIKKVMKEYLMRCEPGFEGSTVIDSSVLRFKGAVTLFGPGSHQHMPSTTTTFQNVFMSGDWLQQGPGAHGARGLSQEKAFVTGLLAANAAASSLGLESRVEIIPVEEDEAHIAAGKSAAQGLRQAARSLGLISPFL